MTNSLWTPSRRGLLKSGAAGAALAVAPIGHSARAVGTGRIYISHEKSHDLAILDGTSFNVIKRIKTSRRPDRKSTRLNSSHVSESRMPSSA